MSRLLHRLGRSTAAHPWRTISAWVLVAVGVFALAGSIGGTPQDNWDIPNARAQVGIDQLREHTPGAGNASARVVVHTHDGSAVDSSVTGPLTQRLEAMDHAVSVSPPRLSAGQGHRPAHRAVRRPGDPPRPLREPRAAEQGGRPHPRRGHPGRARRRPARHRRRPDARQRRADRHHRRPAHPGAGLRLGRRRRPPDRDRAGRSGRRLGRDHPARRHDGRQHRRPDGGHHGRTRRRHRLRTAAGHPVRRVPPGRPRQGRGRRSGRRHGRALGGLRLRDGAGLAARPEAGRPADLRRVRLRHRHRRGRRRVRSPDPGAGPVRPGRSPAAAAQGPQGARREGQPADGALGDPSRPAATGLGTAGHDRDAEPGRTGPVDAHLAAGLLGPAFGADHAQGLRPRRRRVRSRRQRPDHLRRRRVSATPTRLRSRRTWLLATTSPRSRRCSPPPTASCGSSRPSRRSVPPTSAPPAWSTTCAPPHPKASRSPAPLPCSPTSPSCSPPACGSWSASSWRSRCCCSAWCSARSWSRSRQP